ncbi:MAG: hypothetical protein OXH52_00330 [Gammaproteobacteria bacterium]|nr:hypothetical protein [Gammaproteobacteria bacterium]
MVIFVTSLTAPMFDDMPLSWWLYIVLGGLGVGIILHPIYMWRLRTRK